MKRLFDYGLLALGFFLGSPIVELPVLNPPAIVWAQPVDGAPTTFTGTASSCSGAVNSTGTDRGMLFLASLGNEAPVAEVTDANFNGAALTFVAAISHGSTGFRVEAWYLHNPASGSLTFTANFNGSTVFNCHVLVLTNAHQTAALGNSTTATGTSDNPSTNLASASTELVIDILGAAGTGYGTVTVGAEQTERYNAETSDLNIISAEIGSGTTTMSHSWTGGAGFWAHVLVGINEAAAAPGGTQRRSQTIVVQ